MHTSETNASNVPAFLIKLWKLVEDSECNDLISWSEKGNSFIIRNQAIFARELLPQYFKHNNMASFIRQLNMYGFRKVINYEKSGLKGESDEMEFYQPFFMRGQERLLELIKRKVPSTKGTSDTASSRASPKDILTDLTSIQEKQETMNNLLIGIKKENELLWRELSSLRQKHKTQEQIIQKVIQFLLSIVQSGKQNIGMKRKLHHMIQGSPDHPEVKKSHISRQLDVLRGKSSDLVLAVPQDKSSSPVGPVIHEVTELDHEDSDVSGSAVHSVDLNGQSAGSERCGARRTDSPESISEPLDALGLLKPLAPCNPVMSPVSEDELVLGLPVDIPNCNDAVSSFSPSATSAGDMDNVTCVPESSKYATAVDAENVIAIPDYSENIIPVPEDVANVISIPEETATTIGNNDIVTVTISDVITVPDDSGNVITVSSEPAVAPTDVASIVSIPEKSTDNLTTEENAADIPLADDASNVISIPDDAAANICFPEVATPGGSSIALDFGTGSPAAPPAETLPPGNAGKRTAASSLTENAVNSKSAGSSVPLSPIFSPSAGDSLSNGLTDIGPPKPKRRKSSDQCNVISRKDALLGKKNDDKEWKNDKQLAVSDYGSSESSLSKNVFSNHVLNVEEELDWLQDQLASGSLNIDSSMLLGLFSTDEAANNTALANQLALDDHSNFLKDADNVIGNELVQFTPSMLEMDLYNINEPDFLGCLDKANDQLSSRNEEGDQKKDSTDALLANVKQEKDWDNIDCLLSGNSTNSLTSNTGVSSPKVSKSTRNRSRRKAK